MSEMLTIHLPTSLYQQLHHLAELVQQAPETIVAQSLHYSLPPLLKEIPRAYQKDVYPLLQMSVTELQHEVKHVFPAARWVKYEALLAKKKEAALDQVEQQQLDVLRQEADIVTFRKGYAVFSLSELPVPQ